MEIQELIKQLNFSGIHWQILAPLIFSMFDILFGYIQAVINKNIDSQKMRNGLLHKVALMMIMILGFVFDLTFNFKIASRAICLFIIFMEINSILENIKKMGFDVGKLTDFFKQEKGGKKWN